MKKFLDFKNPVVLFTSVGVLLNLISIGLVAFGKIEFDTFLQSTGTITAGIFALYQFYMKNITVVQANAIVEKANLIYQENNALRNEIQSFMSNENEAKDEITVEPQSEVTETPKAKRKYTKKVK